MESQVPEKVPCPYCGKLMRLVGRTATHARYICTGPLSADIRETAADELVGEVIAIVALATAAPPASDPRISHTPRHAPWPMTVLADAQGRPHQRPQVKLKVGFRTFSEDEVRGARTGRRRKRGSSARGRLRAWTDGSR